MIVSGRILEIDGKKHSGKDITTFNLNLKIDHVKVDGEQIEMKYTYIASYNDDSSYITMKGIIKNQSKDMLDAMLYAAKFRGAAISFNEISEIEKI